MREDIEPIAFPPNLQEVIDLEERTGRSMADIRMMTGAIELDSGFLGKLAQRLFGKRPSTFEEARIEATAWVDQFDRRSVDGIAEDMMSRYSLAQIVAAEEGLPTINFGRRRPLDIATLASSSPIRLTLYVLAIRRHYGSGGEAVNIASGLPPKPPAPGHWGGRTPGYEQPIPNDVDSGSMGQTRQ